MVERDAKGRFAKGASGNPQGRLPKQIEQSYLQVSESVCTFDVWREIVMKAVEQAKRGDARARQWLSDYLIGKPISMIMAVQDRQEMQINISWDDENRISNKPITIDWDDTK